MLTHKEFESFLNDDQKAFKKIFDHYHAPLFYYVRKLVKADVDAEEIMQESFVALYLNRRQLVQPDEVYPFLFTIVKRKTVSFFRRKVVAVKYLEQLKIDWKEDEDNSFTKLNEKELHRAHLNSIEELPSRQKQVYKMNKLEHKSYQEIADDLGISRNTVKNQLIAASKIIRLKLSKFYFFIFF